MSDSWIYEQIRTCAIAAHRGQFGVLSTGEQLAAALVLNRHDLLQVAGYTMVEAIRRVGADWLEYLPQVERDLKNEGVI